VKLIEVIAAVLVVVGWAATHLFSEARERRKEERAKIDKYIDSLILIVKDAHRFHTSSEFSEEDRLALQNAIERLDRRLSRIRIIPPQTLSSEQIALRRAITLYNFDPSKFQQQRHDSRILQRINDASMDLEEAIEAQYSKAYPAGFPYFYMHFPSLSKLRTMLCRSNKPKSQ